MAKRKSTHAGDKGRNGGTTANKKIKVADNDNTEGATNEKMGFMGFLPGELRNEIYELALEDLRAAPAEDWHYFRTDFSTFRSLLQVNKQVSAEIKSFFDDMAPSLTVYIDNVSILQSRSDLVSRFALIQR